MNCYRVLRMKKRTTIQFLVEGQTERAFIKALNLLGKVQLINLWDKDISSILARLRADEIYIIYDTDVIHNIERFTRNLRVLKQQKIKFFLLQQTKNLEDEIVRCSNCQTIKDVFGTGIKEFKEQFLACNNLEYKLAEIGIKHLDLWQGKHLEQLSEWKNLRRKFSDLASSK